MRKLLPIGLIILFSIAEAQAQADESFEANRIQIEGFIDYTTSARIYPASRDADPSINSDYNSFSGFLTPGGDIRIVLSRSNAVGVTIQYLKTQQTIYNIYGYNQTGQVCGRSC